MRNLHKILVFSLVSFFVSCTEDIVIDLEKGEPLVGVEAYFTDELKCHEAILSYTTGFYQSEGVRMVSGATVYVTDGVDTVYYHEDSETPGHYLTEPVAGVKNTWYRFCADVPDEGEVDGYLHLVSDSYIPDNVEFVDSLVLKPFNGGNDSIPTVFFGDTIEWLYPYFQSLPDPNIIYMPMVLKNDTVITEDLTQRMIIPQGGFAGYYVNGPEMLLSNKEIPVGYFFKSQLRRGDRIRADLYSIPSDYLMYYYTLMMSSGSNPMMGAPANVGTNIQPEGKGVGWFFTASVVSAETVFDE